MVYIGLKLSRQSYLYHSRGYISTFTPQKHKDLRFAAGLECYRWDSMPIDNELDINGLRRSNRIVTP